MYRDRFDSDDDDFFNSRRGGGGGRNWHREEEMTGIPHDPNWGPKSESLIHDNYESRRGGRRPPPGRRDGPNGRMPPPPRGRGGMSPEIMDGTYTCF